MERSRPWSVRPIGNRSGVYDVRYVFPRGDGVQIIRGRFIGLKATVESRLSPQLPVMPEPSYHVVLDGGRATEGWDAMRSSKPVPERPSAALP